MEIKRRETVHKLVQRESEALAKIREQEYDTELRARIVREIAIHRPGIALE
jgi:hypothetical protein